MLVAPSEVAEILQCDENDAAMLRLLEAASRAINTYCGRTFEWRKDIVEYFDGDGQDVLWVSSPPITDAEGNITYSASSITVWEDDDREFEDADKIDADDLRIDPIAGRIDYAGIFSSGPRIIKVQYNGGYSLSTMPEDVKYACIALVSDWWLHRSYRQLDRLGGQGPLDWPNILPANTLPEKVLQLLQPYRRNIYSTGF